MPELNIDLQEGFEGDRVEIQVDGRTVSRDSVKTRYQIGLADSIRISAGADAKLVTVTLPDRGLSGTFELTGAPYLAVSIKDGAVAFTPSHESFRYM